MGADLTIKNFHTETSNRAWEYERSDGNYFRDPYNEGNVLWLFEESYWELADQCVAIDGASCLPVEATRALLGRMVSKEGNAAFTNNLARKMQKHADGELFRNESAADIEHYYRTEAEALKTFLRRAIRLNAFIQWSV